MYVNKPAKVFYYFLLITTKYLDMVTIFTNNNLTPTRYIRASKLFDLVISILNGIDLYVKNHATYLSLSDSFIKNTNKA